MPCSPAKLGSSPALLGVGLRAIPLQARLAGGFRRGIQDRVRRCRLLHLSQSAVSEGHGRPDTGQFPVRSKEADAITIKKYPNLDRFGQQAGKPNENFFSAGLFVKAFLKPCESVHATEGVADGGELCLVHVGDCQDAGGG